MFKSLEGKKKAAIFLNLFMVLVTIAAIFTALSRNNYSLATGTNVVVLLCMMIIFLLIVKGHYTSAFFLALASVFFQDGLMQNMDRAGTSFALSTLVIVIGSAYAILLLKKSAGGIMYSSILGFITACIDFWGPTTRPLADIQTSKVLLLFVMVSIIGIVFLVIKLWISFDFAT